MPKTQEELNQLKTEYETYNNKLRELSDDELKQVTGGYTVNEDGTYSFKMGEMYITASGLIDHTTLYDVAYDQPNVSKDSYVNCYCYEINAQGYLICENGLKQVPMWEILTCTRYKLQ